MNQEISNKIQESLDIISNLKEVTKEQRKMLKMFIPLFRSSYELLTLFEAIVDMNSKKVINLSRENIDLLVNYAKSGFEKN